MKKLKNIYKLSILIAISLTLSCAKSTAVKVETKDIQQEADNSLQRFNPLELTQDKDIIPKKYPINKDLVTVNNLDDLNNLVNDTTSVISNIIPEAIDTLNNQSYRVQIGISKLFADAKQMIAVAEEIFDRPVTLDYEVPYYKVRVGNFSDRDDAETYVQKAKAAGYANAWVVMVVVNKKEASGLYDDLGNLLFPTDTTDTDSEDNNDSNDEY